MRSFFITTILLFSCFSFAQNSIKLTNWNMEWLSIDGSKVLRTSQDFEKLSYYMAKTQADILAFQEVESITAIQKAVGNDFTIYLSDRSNSSYRHLQFNDTNQYTGFAVRNGVNVLDKPDFSITRGNSKLRFASYLVLNPNQDNEIHLLSVHLKAGCSGTYRNNRDCKIVKQQGQALAKWMKAREDNKQHYVVLGDFNHNLGYRGDWLWRVLSDDTDAKLMTKDTQAQCKVRSNRNPNKTHQFRSMIDHIIVSGQLMASPSVQTVFKTQDVLDYKLSDHCPVSSVLSF